MITSGRRIELRGIVQGVGFRPWIYNLASQRGVTGRVSNGAAGVVIEAFGPQRTLDDFADRVMHELPPAVEILEVSCRAIEAERLDGFAIVPSTSGDDVRVSIPPDLATCPECAGEIFDRANRRYRYAFTNCTHCGPRFTIAHDVPYDRATTTMAAFTMCEACRREYDDPANRRFHAQPNACPQCGPRLALISSDGRDIPAADPIASAAAALAVGAIVAVKGLGGFHLACDATNAAVIARLRQRKRRDQKPFAVMVRDITAAESLAVLHDDDRSLLESPARPIVLVRPRPGSQLAEGVAPDAPLVGLMLPYTPLHHLLLHDARRPLIMTSGNVADEPLVYQNGDARTRLAELADFILLHDRDIDAFCDDSVARNVAGAPLLIRRSRGYVPRAVAISPSCGEPILACGALLKNTFCIAMGDTAYPGPHIGDLDNLACFDAYGAAIDRMERFLRVTPRVVAHDLHPDYLSTRYALSRAGAHPSGVQHHHAHIASVLAEHALTGPVIGVAYDGTGYGTDGAAWGGEILLARLDDFERVATLRPIALLGGDAAIREPWRLAVALLHDAFDGTVPESLLARFDGIPRARIDAVRQMIGRGHHAPLAHGAGRYFDAIGSLVLERPHSAFEGQIALAWNGAADDREGGGYPFIIDRSAMPWSIDLRLMVQAIVNDLAARESSPVIAARFHNTLAEATAAAVESVASIHGALPVALSGGCFQNPRLAESLMARLTPRFAVYLNRRVPPGDGGIALGQAAVAAAVLRGR